MVIELYNHVVVVHRVVVRSAILPDINPFETANVWSEISTCLEYRYAYIIVETFLYYFPIVLKRSLRITKEVFS